MYVTRAHAPLTPGRLSLGILFTGELWEFLSFAERYPAVIYNILLFGLTSALGQVSASGRGGVASLRETGLAGGRGVSHQAPMARHGRRTSWQSPGSQADAAPLVSLEFHLHDSCVFWPPDLLYHHYDSEVLHHLGLRDPLCQPHQPPAVGGHRARVLG